MNTPTPTLTQAGAIDGRAFSRVRLPGIRIPTSYIVRAARRRDPADARAMRWLASYASLRGLDLEDFAEQVGLDIPQMREALSHPHAEPAIVKVFTAGVKRLRVEFERRLKAGSLDEAAQMPNIFRPGSPLHDGYGPLANTRVLRDVKRAVRTAAERRVMAEVIGLTRLGKSAAGAHEYLERLDEAVYFACPSDTSERCFLLALARAVGCSTRDNGMTAANIRASIEECFEEGGYSIIMVDEGHYLWHRGRNRHPCRLELLRQLRDMGVGIVILATPQFTDHLAQAFADDPMWAPGQFDGRVQPFRLPDTLTDADISAVARHHAPEFGEELISELVNFAKSSHGYLGAMVNVIQRARDAFEEFPGRDRMELLRAAQDKQEKGRRAELLTAGKIVPIAPRRNGRRAA